MNLNGKRIMLTKIKVKGKEISFQTQQYESGLYLKVSSDPMVCCIVHESEEKCHKKLIETAVKEGDEVTYTSYPEVLEKILKKQKKEK